MTTEIQCDEPVLVGQTGFQLAPPGEPALRKAVDKQDRTAVRVTFLDHMELCASASADAMMFHGEPSFQMPRAVPSGIRRGGD